MSDIVQEINKTLADTSGLVNVMDSQCRTLLHLASLQGKSDMVDLLLRHRAIVDMEDMFQADAFSYAVKSNDLRTIHLLVPYVNINAYKLKKTTILHAYIDQEHVVDGLIRSRRVHVDERDYYYSTPLMHAIRKGAVDTMQCLLKRGAQLDARDESGKTPLHMAAINGSIGMISTLLLHSAFACQCMIDAKDNQGNTPLHWAATYSNQGAIELLLRRGASTRVKNKWNQLPG